MRDVAIKKICSKLVSHYNIKLEDKIALDFFAREADWQTQYYAERVKQVYAWEIEPKHEKGLKENLPNSAKITIGDSHILAKDFSPRGFFDIIVLDNPQGCYGKDNVYCEHFDALTPSADLLKDSGGLLIFNVKTKPFNYENNHRWQKRRNDFYNLEDCSNLSEDFVFKFYKDYFQKLGYETNLAFMQSRPQETGLSAMTIGLFREGS